MQIQWGVNHTTHRSDPHRGLINPDGVSEDTGTFLVEGAASGAARPRPRESHRFARLAWPPNHTTRKHGDSCRET